MLFNSYEFIILFLPATLFVFLRLMKGEKTSLALGWLVVASLFFYGWWNPSYLALLVFSLLFNYLTGMALTRVFVDWRKTILVVGVLVNVGVLGYYKYGGFIVTNANYFLGTGWNFDNVILPLAISFFTFQQIAYLVDAYSGKTSEASFLHYCLFVTFFPQLIAGPIVHHKEMMPQFLRDSGYLLNRSNLAVGITIFVVGLFKKVFIADTLARYSTPVFDAASDGTVLTFFQAWGGVFAYTFQLYFDFSAYSDMAIGIARMFGIRLPVNFDSPYKATSIIEFWRRWHITLSRFLRDYIYIPLGGNRAGVVRRYINLMVTMLIGGLWHGAGWNFVLWGALHGIYLLINHAWRWITNTIGLPRAGGGISPWWGRGLTFLAVAIAWVPFRASDLSVTMAFYQAMLGLNGFVLPETYQTVLMPIMPLLSTLGWGFETTPFLWDSRGASTFGLLLLFVWFAPNTYQFTLRYRPALLTSDYFNKRLSARFYWRPTLSWAVVMFLLMAVTLLNLGNVSEFLYFQF